MSGVLLKVTSMGPISKGLSPEKLENAGPAEKVLFYHHADVLVDGEKVGVEVVAAFV